MQKTSVNCENLIPSGLIKHLWLSAESYGDDGCFFILTPRRLGDAFVQDILILSEKSSSHQTVFGYRPVNMTVGVSHAGADAEMHIIRCKTSENSNMRRNIARAFFFHHSYENRHADQMLCLGKAR